MVVVKLFEDIHTWVKRSYKTTEGGIQTMCEIIRRDRDEEDLSSIQV